MAIVADSDLGVENLKYGRWNMENQTATVFCGSRESRGSKKTPYSFQENRSLSQRSENRQLRNSGRSPPKWVSATTGASERSMTVIWRPFLKNLIPRKPGVGRREHGRYLFSGKYRNVILSRSWEKAPESTQECPLSEWNKCWDDLMTFIERDILEKLEDKSGQTRRLPWLAPEYEETEVILRELVSVKSGKSPEQMWTVSGRSENLSPRPMFGRRLEEGARSYLHQTAMTSRKTTKTEDLYSVDTTAASAIFKRWPDERRWEQEEDGSKQTRRLRRLGPEKEASLNENF